MTPISNVVIRYNIQRIFYLGHPGEHLYLSPQNQLHVGRRNRPTRSRCSWLVYRCFGCEAQPHGPGLHLTRGQWIPWIPTSPCISWEALKNKLFSAVSQNFTWKFIIVLMACLQSHSPWNCYIWYYMAMSILFPWVMLSLKSSTGSFPLTTRRWGGLLPRKCWKSGGAAAPQFNAGADPS